MPPQNPEQARWFAAEVLPHSALLRSDLRRAFPAMTDVDDVVQESLLRLGRVRAGQPIRSARAFLFGVARRLAIDLIREERIAPRVAFSDAAAAATLDAARDPAEEASVRHEMELLAQAIDTLPARCREIVVLRKLDGLSHRRQRRGLCRSVGAHHGCHRRARDRPDRAAFRAGEKIAVTVLGCFSVVMDDGASLPQP